MPQQTMFPDPTAQPWRGLRLTIQSHPLKAETSTIVVEGGRPGGGWSTVWVGEWSDIMHDLLPTLATDLVTAWAWGERRSLPRAAASASRAARAHQRQHTY